MSATTSVTVRLRGGPFDGQTAVAPAAIVVGQRIRVRGRAYRVTLVDSVPGWTDLLATAMFEKDPPRRAR